MNRSEPKSPDPAEEVVGLIAQAQRRLYAFVLALVRRPAEVDDILQEINVVLWRKRETYRSSSDFFAWAFAIARLQVLAYHARQQRREARFEDSHLEELAATAAAESEMYDRRERALGRASKNCRRGSRP
jgi:RNA polymerase sigma-70 factor, ECF subfamily